MAIKNDPIAGGGDLVTCSLRQGNRDTWGWYFERGEIIKALFTGEEIAQFIASIVAPKSFREAITSTPPVDLIKLSVVSILTVFFALAVVIVVIAEPGNQSLQFLTGFLGLSLGYFVGKSDMPS